mgnify:CR=1 FL=1
MTRLLTAATWAVLILAAAPFALLALYEVGCAVEALRERRIERRDRRDRWPE